MVCTTRERTRSCGTGTLPESRITRTKQVRAPPSSGTTTVVTLPPVNAIARDRTHRFGSQSPRTANRATWFEYRRYSPGLVRGAVFGIRTPRRVQYPRLGPAPDISLPACSPPSEITAIALTAFSHVPVARVTLVVLGNERKREILARVKRNKKLGLPRK